MTFTAPVPSQGAGVGLASRDCDHGGTERGTDGELSPLTPTVTNCVVVAPLPARPSTLSPQHMTAPLTTAQVCSKPAAMAVTPPVNSGSPRLVPGAVSSYCRRLARVVKAPALDARAVIGAGVIPAGGDTAHASKTSRPQGHRRERARPRSSGRPAGRRPRLGVIAELAKIVVSPTKDGPAAGQAAV